MLLDVIAKDTTDYSVTIRVVDSTDGTPETSVAFDTAGVDLWYRRPGSAHTSITEVTQTEAGAHTDGGFVHISDGYCRLDLPDAAAASGADYFDVGGTFTGMVVVGGRVRLTDVDLDDSVRGGMTALPNVNAGANNGLPLGDASGDVTLADGAHGGTSAVITVDHIIADSTADHALYLNANAASKHALFAYAEGANGDGCRFYSTTGKGWYTISTGGYGFHAQGGGANPGMQVDAGAGADTPGIKVNGGASGAAHAIELQPAGTGLPIADNSNNHILVDLKDDAITSAKYDESTAFPLPGAITVANSCVDANLERIHDDALNATKPFDTV